MPSFTTLPRRHVSTTQKRPAQPAAAPSATPEAASFPQGSGITGSNSFTSSNVAGSFLQQLPFFPDEPREPIVRTEIPGPKGREAIKELDQVFETRSLNMMAHYGESVGN